MRAPALKPCRTRSTTTGPRNLRVSLLTMVASLPSYQRLLEPRFTSHIRTRLGSVAQARTPMDCLGNSSRKGSLSEQLPWLKFKQSNPHWTIVPDGFWTIFAHAITTDAWRNSLDHYQEFVIIVALDLKIEGGYSVPSWAGKSVVDCTEAAVVEVPDSIHGGSS